MPQAPKRAAVTLVECIVASFILLGCCLIVLQLFFYGMRSTTSSYRRVEGTLFAQKVTTSIREWAGDINNFQSDWSAWTTTNVTDTQYPGYSAQVDVVNHEIYSPCSQLEMAYPLNQRRSMSQSLKRVTLQIRGVGDSDAPQGLDFFVGEPIHAPTRVEAVVSDGDLVRNEVTPYRARFFDAAGRLVPDIAGGADTRPGTRQGDGTLTPHRYGDRGSFMHELLEPDGDPYYAAPNSTVALRLSGHYGGVTLGNSTTPILLR